MSDIDIGMYGKFQNIGEKYFDANKTFEFKTIGCRHFARQTIEHTEHISNIDCAIIQWTPSHCQ